MARNRLPQAVDHTGVELALGNHGLLYRRGWVSHKRHGFSYQNHPTGNVPVALQTVLATKILKNFTLHFCKTVPVAALAKEKMIPSPLSTFASEQQLAAASTTFLWSHRISGQYHLQILFFPFPEGVRSPCREHIIRNRSKGHASVCSVPYPSW